MTENPSRYPGQKIGLTCSYIPEELVMAAGMEPVQVQGLASENTHSLSYTCNNMCPFVENLLESGLSHRFEHLSGIIFANSCDCMRRLYDLWTRYVKSPFSYMLEIPKNQSREGVAYFADRLLDLKKSLESAFGLSITEQDLKSAIAISNDRRKMMMDVMNGQKEFPPRFSGSELFSALTSGPDEHPFTRKPVQSLSGEPEKPRLLITGNRIERNPLFEMVENAGGVIVIPDYCNGFKDINRQVDEALPPVEAIAEGYLNGPACLRMPEFEGRLTRIRHLIHDYQIHGILYHRLKNCDYGMFETPQLENFAKDMGIPLLVLETDYLWQDTIRIRTRIDAFMEMLTTNLENSS